MAAVETYDLTHAAELIAALRLSVTPLEPRPPALGDQTLPWQEPNVDRRHWLFRGLADAAYDLIPSAARPGTWRPASPNGVQIDPWVRHPQGEWTHADQIRAEHALIHRFARMIDVQGLRLPDGSSTFADDLAEGKYARPKKPADWPPPSMRALVALAQHYGVPTRLLDWSRKPLVAAYFAASGCAEKVDAVEPTQPPSTAAKAPQHFAIWALDRRFVEQDAGLDLVRAPRADNPNLHLQSGLFTLLRPSVKAGAPFDPKAFDLEAHCRREAPASQPPVLVRLTLPAAEAGPLLGALRDDFIQATTIHAGFQGAALSVLEHRLRG